MIKILFVGLGSIGQRHLRNLRLLMGDSVEIIAYRNLLTVPVLDDRQNVIENADLTEMYQVREIDSLDKAFAEKPEIVFITNPSSMHVDVAIQAAKSGCHLFIEKPLGVQHEGIPELIRWVERKHLVALIAYQLRFHPGLKIISDWLREQRIGRLISAHVVNGEYLPNFHPYEDYRISYASRSELGGGCILSQIHEFDYIYYLFGKARRVFALGGKLGDLDIDVEDTASILMECIHGGHVLPVSLCLDFAQVPTKRTCTIIGTSGKIEWDLQNGSLELQESDSKNNQYYDFSKFDRNEMFIAELHHFFQCISGESQPMVDVRSGYVSLEMALAARASLKDGKAQELS